MLKGLLKEVLKGQKIIRIRAHHPLCMQGFQGYGYGQNFVDNMTKIIKDMDSSTLEIIAECDIICSHCPYNVIGVCQKRPDSAEKVRDMDEGVLRKLDLKEGARGRAEDILSLVNKKLNISDIRDICKDCEWKEKCLWFREK